ncbi:inositol hexakisphosphate-domain-containing protein, partial [Fimicolochytrium jonesii]|uniref:inositol hexakisphosphate-domain-containing protein n=1 Tax=Fimicolochytrium jonesii TaxID=1396493 RepID=UPI0022FE2655
GSVLCRQTILKSDHYETSERFLRAPLRLEGAPNFRRADPQILGAAQPTITGIRTILMLLQIRGQNTTRKALWFSAREEPIVYLDGKPFVLRENERPFTNIRSVQGISSTRLEQMEARLKEDIEREASKWNGMLLVHEESEGKLVPTWMAIDRPHIQTPREVFDAFVAEGFPVTYFRVPVSGEQAPEDRFIDTYINAITSSRPDDALIFTCGMGKGRTTFAMVLAMIIRNAQYGERSARASLHAIRADSSRIDLTALEESESQNTAMLRLVHVLEQGLASSDSARSALDWIFARAPLISDMKSALLGGYRCIMELASTIHNGTKLKKKLDEIIDLCDAMVNMREDILLHRVKYSVNGESKSLRAAVACLGRYYFLLAFFAYAREVAPQGFDVSFTQWLERRPEIGTMLRKFRVSTPQLILFRPLDDLSMLTGGDLRMQNWQDESPSSFEWEKHVIRSRHGAVLAPHNILKVDHWDAVKDVIEGAPRFRKLRTANIYATAQPTIQGMKNVIQELQQRSGDRRRAVWINLREEPLVYINGIPYVLRDEFVTLRNIKSYSGIDSARLELMEESLKRDVVAELSTYDESILLHMETPNGEVVAQWEHCSPENVHTLQEVFNLVRDEQHASESAIEMDYARIPITAESAPSPSDFADIQKVICAVDLKDSAILMVCQTGKGRSSTGCVVAYLVLLWLGAVEPPQTKSVTRPNYSITNSLLRVVRDGVESKRLVDDVIDECGEYLNIRDDIEASRVDAMNAPDDMTRRAATDRGLVQLKRYFLLIAFQSYLAQNPPGLSNELQSFSSWLQKRPELKGMVRIMGQENDIHALTPVEHLRPGDGMALSTEVLEVVKSRKGAVLSQGSILKGDMFPGAQKLSLTERVDGAPNFRRISLSKVQNQLGRNAILTGTPSSDKLAYMQFQADAKQDPPASSSLYGIGMPTKPAIRRALEKVGAVPDGSRRLVWTSLREEPVLYVSGVPYVLRLLQDPLSNLETTGIVRERVELMESQMKLDALAELKHYGGRLLLHEEEVTEKGFSIVPVWETVSEDAVQTPSEVYKCFQAEGYKVDYLRIPITDEQAPIPEVFDLLVDRLTRLRRFTDIMFNCQMGRGRTTTGMIITCLVETIVGNHHLVAHSNPPQNESAQLTPPSWFPSSTSPYTETDDDQPEQVRRRYARGEYRLILRLLAVLTHGKHAKLVTDNAIDACDHVQNLRLAVYDYKLRVESMAENTPAEKAKKDRMMNVARNYLVRYFYLIVFADYLMEVWAGWRSEGKLTGSPTSTAPPSSFGSSVSYPPAVGKPRRMPIKFSEWLRERREIVNLVRNADNQSLD